MEGGHKPGNEDGKGHNEGEQGRVGYVEPVGNEEGEDSDTVGVTQNDIMDEDQQENTGDDVVLMQKSPLQDYEQVLQNLLKAMDEMTGPKAARLSGFLRQIDDPAKTCTTSTKPAPRGEVREAERAGSSVRE